MSWNPYDQAPLYDSRNQRGNRNPSNNNRRGGARSGSRSGPPSQHQQPPSGAGVRPQQQPTMAPPYYVDSFGQPIDENPNLKRQRVDPSTAYYGFSPAQSHHHHHHHHPNHHHHNQQHRFNSYNNQQPPFKAKQTRVYSDFRVARIKIGDFELDESKSTSNANRDSRIRLYFKNSDTTHVASPNPELSAKERALTEPDRMSISMYHGTKRLVIPVQDGLEAVVFNRSEGHFKIKSKGWALFEEITTNTTNNSGSSSTNHFVKCGDLTGGELEKTNGAIDVWIDKQNPLPMEPKWTRGNIVDYIDSRSKFRTMDVLRVEDPENIVNFDSVVDLWTRESNISSLENRREFVANTLYQLDYMLELSSKILAPQNYYVSKNSANDTSTKNAHLATQIIETGSIPALISPAVNALLAVYSQLSLSVKGKDKEKEKEFVESLKLVIYQAPEPIIWRSLDGLFGKRNEPLNFNAGKLLDGIKGHEHDRQEEPMDTEE